MSKYVFLHNEDMSVIISLVCNRICFAFRDSPYCRCDFHTKVSAVTVPRWKLLGGFLYAMLLVRAHTWMVV